MPRNPSASYYLARDILFLMRRSFSSIHPGLGTKVRHFVLGKALGWNLCLNPDILHPVPLYHIQAIFSGSPLADIWNILVNAGRVW